MNPANIITDLLGGLAARVTSATVSLPGVQGTVERHFVRDDHKLVTVDARPPARRHVLDDLESLAEYAKRRVKPGLATLFCSPDGFVLMVDDREDTYGEIGTETGREYVTFKPVKTDALSAWEALATPRPHVKFKDAIDDRSGDLVEQALLTAVLKFSLRTEIAYDTDLGDGKQIGFVVSEKQGGPQQAKLPKTFLISIPIFEGWPKSYVLDCRVAFEAEGPKVIFWVEIRNLQTVLDTVMADMVRDIMERLGPGWLVVRGMPKVSGGPA